MIAVLLGVGVAAELQGTVLGAPFEAKGALGLTDPATPGVLQVALTSIPLSCEEVRAMRAEGAEKPKDMPTLVLAVFQDPASGSEAVQVMAVGKAGLGGFKGTVTLASLPESVDATGTLALDLKGGGALALGGEPVKKAKKDALKGEVAFRLCDAVAARPDVSSTTFEPSTHHFEQKSVFPDEPPTVLDIAVALPRRWKAGAGPLGDPQWKAPDGLTVFELSLASPSDPMAEGLAEQTKSQVEAFQTKETVGEMMRAEAVGDGTYVAQWRYRWGDGPWTNQLDVFRQDPAWEHQVRCTVRGDDTAVAQIFADAEKACVGISPL